MDPLDPKSVGAPLLGAVQQKPRTPQDILAEIGKRATASIADQRTQLNSAQKELKTLQDKPKGMDPRILAALADQFTGSNLSGLAHQVHKQNDTAGRQAQLERLIQRQQGGITDDELNLLKAQYQQVKPDDWEAKLQKQYELKGSLLEKAAQLKANKNSGGKELTANMVKKINEGNAIPDLLDDVDATLENTKDAFGPFTGRFAAMNPYDERVQTIDAQMRATSQAFGKFMEGGVLRKEDEDKYRKMFPNVRDTPAVAKNKLAVVRRLLQKRQRSDIEAFGEQGYDLRGLERSNATAKIPAILSGKNISPSTSPVDFDALTLDEINSLGR